jgi:hypothetical protein
MDCVSFIITSFDIILHVQTTTMGLPLYRLTLWSIVYFMLFDLKSNGFIGDWRNHVCVMVTIDIDIVSGVDHLGLNLVERLTVIV